MLIFNRAAALAERLKIHLLGCCEMVAAVGAVLERLTTDSDPRVAGQARALLALRLKPGER